MLDRDQPMPEISQEPLLRRLLLKTKPWPFAIWMAAIGAMPGCAIALSGWLQIRDADAALIFLLFMFPTCLGCLMGLFVAKQMKLRWFATFGEVLEINSKPLRREDKVDQRTRLILKAGFGLSLAALIAVTSFLALRI
jgi:hypothetical protein